MVRHPLSEYLRECGYEVIEAASSNEAQRISYRRRETGRRRLCRCAGPDNDGFTFAAWIRENRPEVKVILAGTLAKTVAKAGELCGDGPALTKPYDHQLVLDRIRRLLATKDRGGSAP
ncbi:MAG: response regulator [Aliidongia sp.]